MAEEGGGKSKLVLIIVAVVLLIVIGAVAFFLLSGGEEEEGEIPEEELPVTETVEPLAVPLFLPLESYVVNLKDGRRYLKASIQLMMSDPAAMAYLKEGW